MAVGSRLDACPSTLAPLVQSGDFAPPAETPAP